MAEAFPHTDTIALPSAVTLGLAALELKASGVPREGPLTEVVMQAAESEAAKQAMAEYQLPTWPALEHPQLVIDGLKITDLVRLNSESDLVSGVPDGEGPRTSYAKRLVVSSAQGRWDALSRPELVRRMVESEVCIPHDLLPIELTSEQLSVMSLMSRGWHRFNVISAYAIRPRDWALARNGFGSAFRTANTDVITARLFCSRQLIKDRYLHPRTRDLELE